MEDFPLNELLSATDLDKIHVYNGNEGRECRLARCSLYRRYISRSVAGSYDNEGLAIVHVYLFSVGLKL